MNFDLKTINKIKSDAFGLHSQQVAIWRTLAMWTDQTHYLKFGSSSDYGGGNNSNNNRSNVYFNNIPNTWATNMALANSIKIRITKDINLTFNDGILLSLQKDYSNVGTIIFNNSEYEDYEKKSIWENANKYLKEYGAGVLLSIKHPKTNGAIVINNAYKELCLFGNTCYQVNITKNNHFIFRHVPLDSVAIVKDGDLQITHFFIKKLLNLIEAQSLFKKETIAKLMRLYPDLQQSPYSQSILISENVIYDRKKNISTIFYIDENSEDVIESKQVLGVYYIYTSIGQNVNETYGVSELLKNLHNIIYLQSLDFTLKEMVNKEATPEILQFIQNGSDKNASINNQFLSGAYAQALGNWNNLQNKVNRSQLFNMDNIGGIKALSGLGINPFVDLITSPRNGETISLLRGEREQYEQQLDTVLGGGIASQLNNYSFKSNNVLKTDTFSEIAYRAKSDNANEASHYDELLPFVSSVFNRHLEITMQYIIEKIQQLRNDQNYNDEEIILYATKYHNVKNPVQSIFFQDKLSKEIQNLKNNLKEEINNPELEASKKDLRLLNEEILQIEKMEKKQDDDYQKMRLQKQLQKLKAAKTFYHKNLFQQIYKKVEKETIDFYKKIQQKEDIRDFILFYLPEDFLKYILGYLETYKTFENAFKLEFVSSELRRIKNRERAEMLETIPMLNSVSQLITNLSQTEQGKQILDGIDERELVASVLKPISSQLLLSKKESDKKTQERQQAEIQMQQQLAQIQSEN